MSRLSPRRLAWRVSRLRERLRRRLRRIDQRTVRLEPEGAPSGTLLLSYILDPLLDRTAGRRAPVDHSHTHFWETLCIAETFLELGMRVDAMAWTNQRWAPPPDRRYDLIFDVRNNLERLAPLLDDDAVRVFHCDTAHWAFHNRAQRERLAQLEERRGLKLAPRRLMPENRGLEAANVATYLGNAFTRSTYAFTSAPMLRVPVSVPCTYPWPGSEGTPPKDFDRIRRSFVWFGSGGLVHKGLDLVLEAFAGLPELQLTVCGPIGAERDFERAYARELYRTPNIRTLGWIDVRSAAFARIAREALGLVYPSCSEGGGSSALTCMHAAMIPILTVESSIDLTSERGLVLADASVEAIRHSVLALSQQPAEALEAMARASWTFARRRHTREHFAQRFNVVAERLVGAALHPAVADGSELTEDAYPDEDAPLEPPKS